MRETVRLATMDQLRRHVHEVLCRHDHLDPEQAPLRQAVVTRRGRPCGLFFQVEGPRLLRGYAVWAGDENRILFYDSRGERTGESRLSEAPDPRGLAA
jgi:hypothetical protein